jgi:hypothetical protein
MMESIKSAHHRDSSRLTALRMTLNVIHAEPYDRLPLVSSGRTGQGPGCSPSQAEALSTHHLDTTITNI